MSTTVHQKAGRKYTVESAGVVKLERDYIVTQSAVMSADGEVAAITGIPAIGSAHPTHTALKVTSYDVKEGAGADKKTLVVTVHYGLLTTESSGSGGSVTCIVDEWGWDDGTEEKELTSDSDGVAVLNSAGDPFESVPKVSVSAPTFTKVMRFTTRQSDWSSALCKVNGGSVSIGGKSFPEGTLLCSASEKRILDGGDFKYQYSVRLRYKSNPVKIAGASTVTDIGWDAAVVDAGMREKDAQGKKKLIRMRDEETGKMCTVTAATLLNGSGGALAANGTPYVFRFKAYERETFPSWFYSEPS